MGERVYDVVLYGATSFVGQIVCRHLAQRHGDDGGLRWAIAGRNADKLERVAADVGADVPRLVADADDRVSLDELVASTHVVATTVGPYAIHGSPLVAAAVAAGTDYCDLTGETPWMRRMIDGHHDDATSSGARVVHACGFDSVPSDLGVWFLQREAVARFGEPCSAVRMGLAGASGGFSGGTVASLFNVLDEARHDPGVRRLLADPYALVPDEAPPAVRSADITWPVYDDGLDSWLAAFVMAAINTRVVHRTHFLLGRPWGDGFTYAEGTMTGGGMLGRAKALAMSGGLAGFQGAAAFGPVRSLLGRVLPEPGEGPSAAKQAAGWYDLRFHGRTGGGRELTVQVTGDADPGYGSTAKMFGEVAAALVELDRGEVGGGFRTPASALGDRLLDRLEAHAGMTFEVIDGSP